MLNKLFALLVCALLASCSSSSDSLSLFNGKDLSGWKDNSGLWSVKDGVIYGSTHGHKLPSNRFLIWDGEVENFELTYEARVEGDNNSGVMYRANVHPTEPLRLQGNQCDLHPKAEYCGMLYSEATKRNILAERGTKVVVSAKTLKPEVVGKTSEATPVDIIKWHTYKIIAKGNQVQHFVDGKLAIDIVDHHPQANKKGLIGLQLHRGKPMKAYFRNIQLKKLD
ncbi:MAG: DUF1080 domain-containing protein [Lentisphaeraceae bacterium]|nr:DUF1080 domain-containing protein [Lentisphaeraceae bacterium]